MHLDRLLLLLLLWPTVAGAQQLAYVNSLYDTVQVVDLDANVLVDTIPVGGQPLGVAVSPDGRRVYVSCFTDGVVAVIDTRSNSVFKTITIGAGAFGIAASEDGSRVYVTSYDGPSVAVIDTDSLTVAATVAVAGLPLAVAVSPDGGRVYVRDGLCPEESAISAPPWVRR